MRKEMLLVSLFVFSALVDLSLRLFWLEREQWTCNVGVFWGIPLPPVLLWLGIAGIFIWCLWLWSRLEGALARGALLAILIGGGVNVIDRLIHGCVLDYLSWPFGLSAFFPNFNLSDMLVLLGLLGLGWIFLTHHDI